MGDGPWPAEIECNGDNLSGVCSDGDEINVLGMCFTAAA